MSQPSLCWCGAAAVPVTPGTRPHCSDEHQEIDHHVPFDIAPYATLFREMPADYQPPALDTGMMVDGAQLVPGEAFWRSAGPASDDGVYRVSTGQWSDRE